MGPHAKANLKCFESYIEYIITYKASRNNCSPCHNKDFWQRTSVEVSFGQLLLAFALSISQSTSTSHPPSLIKWDTGKESIFSVAPDRSKHSHFKCCVQTVGGAIPACSASHLQPTAFKTQVWTQMVHYGAQQMCWWSGSELLHLCNFH